MHALTLTDRQATHMADHMITLSQRSPLTIIDTNTCLHNAGSLRTFLYHNSVAIISAPDGSIMLHIAQPDGTFDQQEYPDATTLRPALILAFRAQRLRMLHPHDPAWFAEELQRLEHTTGIQTLYDTIVADAGVFGTTNLQRLLRFKAPDTHYIRLPNGRYISAESACRNDNGAIRRELRNPDEDEWTDVPRPELITRLITRWSGPPVSVVLGPLWLWNTFEAFTKNPANSQELRDLAQTGLRDNVALIQVQDVIERLEQMNAETFWAWWTQVQAGTATIRPAIREAIEHKIIAKIKQENQR